MVRHVLNISSKNDLNIIETIRNNRKHILDHSLSPDDLQYKIAQSLGSSSSPSNKLLTNELLSYADNTISIQNMNSSEQDGGSKSLERSKFSGRLTNNLSKASLENLNAQFLQCDSSADDHGPPASHIRHHSHTNDAGITTVPTPRALNTNSSPKNPNLIQFHGSPQKRRFIFKRDSNL